MSPETVTVESGNIKSAGEQLLMAGSNYMEFFDFLPQIYFEAGLDGKVIYANKYALEYMGYSESDMKKGLYLLDMLHPAFKYVAKNNIDLVMRGKNSDVIEYILKRKDGKLFSGLIYTSPVRIDNRIAGIRGLVIDITERKKVENALEHTESRFKTIFNNSYEAIFFVENNKIVDCNDRSLHMFGYSREEILDTQPDMLSPAFQPDGSNSDVGLQNYSFSAYKGIHQFFEWQFRKKDSSLFFTEVSMSKIETWDETLLLYVVRDISERKKHENKLKRLYDDLEKKVAERTVELKAVLDRVSNSNIEHQILIDKLSRESEKLIKVNKKLEVSEKSLKEALDTKDKFFSIIAHDIKNPLYSIILNSEILVNYGEGFNHEKLIQKHNQIYMTTKRLNELLENLLQWARSQMGKINFEPSEFDLNKTVGEIADLFKPHLENKGITLDNNIPRHKIIYADLKLINTVIRNLVSNAIKFSDKGGKIEVNELGHKDYMEIWIKDYGVGIAPDRASEIFKSGKASTTHGTEKEKGTGLGLILCREFVELHGGNIWVTSEPGKGSEFHFTIPFKRRL